MFLQKLFRFVPRSTLRRALSHFNRGEFEEAAELFEEVILKEKAPPEDVALYACESLVEIGKHKLANNDLPGALRAYERAAALRPEYADVQLQLGQLYEQSEQMQGARQAYKRALAINPRYFEARLSLARLLMQEDGVSEAMHHLQEAAEHGPEFATSQVLEALDSLPEDDASHKNPRLESLFDNLLSTAPTPVMAGIEVARRAMRDGDNRRAIAEIKKLLKVNPAFPDLHNLLGVAYDNEEMVDDAIEEFEQSLHLNTNFIDARINLGLTLFGRGRYGEADHHLQLVAKGQPGNKLVQSVLSQIAARGTV